MTVRDNDNKNNKTTPVISMSAAALSRTKANRTLLTCMHRAGENLMIHPAFHDRQINNDGTYVLSIIITIKQRKQ